MRNIEAEMKNRAARAVRESSNDRRHRRLVDDGRSFPRRAQVALQAPVFEPHADE
jgi:hypothetical protein